MPAPRTMSSVAIVVALLLAGCGRGSDRVPNVAGLPLVRGAQIVVNARLCDPGANAFCADDLVVSNSRFHNSEQFLQSERHELHRLGWTGANAPNGEEHAANSPHGRLHVTFATADGDERAIDLGWIQRSHQVAIALSKALFDHTATLSLQLQSGAAS
jgi:hypothetical protein